jgi:hypothetical protein
MSDLTDAEMHERMANGWRGGMPFTVCGTGSLPSATVHARKVLPEWCAKYGLRTVVDAGAGDMQWMRGMKWAVDYQPFDLYPRTPAVTEIDITTQVLPSCDLILCRMVLNHIQPRVPQTLELFRKAGKYLAATQYDGKNLPQRSKQFFRLDLTQWLGPPLESVPDGGDEFSRLALWRLDAV